MRRAAKTETVLTKGIGKMSDQVRVDTCRGLFDSLGVEDIAIKYGHNVEDVRRTVDALRAAYLLPSIIQQAGERHAKRKAQQV